MAAKEQTPVILVLMLITARADTAEQRERVRLPLKIDASFFYFFFNMLGKVTPHAQSKSRASSTSSPQSR